MYAYTNSGNQLTNVEDLSDNLDGFEDDSSDIAIEYTYDANGNMITDINKEITNISYNHLNLPELVSFEDGKYVRYLYDAAGIKLQKIAGVYDAQGNSANEVTTDYVGGGSAFRKHYKNGRRILPAC